MRHLATSFLVLGLVPAQAPTPAANQKLDLKVLYAGVPGPRTDEWRAFLEPRTAGFQAIATEQVTAEAAKGFDVVVVDCPDPVVKNDKGEVQRLAVPKAPGIGADFGRPVVFGGAMAMVPNQLELLLGWL
jgi:hypothetical protein